MPGIVKLRPVPKHINARVWRTANPNPGFMLFHKCHLLNESFSGKRFLPELLLSIFGHFFSFFLFKFLFKPTVV